MEKLILSKIDETDRNFILDNYLLISLEKLRNKDDRIVLTGIDEDKTFGEYKLVFHNDERNSINKYYFLEFIRDNRQDIDSLSDIKFEHLTSIVERPSYMVKRMPRFIRNEIVDIIKEFGDYGVEEATRDYMKHFYVETWFIKDNPEEAWLKIDFNSLYQLAKIKIHSGFSWGEEILSDFSVQYFEDDIWKDISEAKINNSQEIEKIIEIDETIITDKIKIQSNTDNKFRIREIQVYGTPPPLN